MSDTRTVGEALREFYHDNYFGDDAFTKPWVHVHLGPLKLPFPNPKPRRDAIHLHDISHLVTGYDTSFTGEGELAAWELASGFGKHWIGWLYAPLAFTTGCLVSPVRVAKAFKRGWRQKNLYRMSLDRETLEAMNLNDLKRLLGLEPRGQMTRS